MYLKKINWTTSRLQPQSNNAVNKKRIECSKRQQSGQ